ncbi:TetR/AcrR family transcriptional regulator [Dietzia cinnamea]|uniref:TetR/AcrR family transcriptional regulator n=1 Tax=Dietzia cinnamea TaxID=321318 RepID=UPI00223BD3CD|nr:TetR/AcrR family transcriptional regulator [Dietzia cinnamea]MCT2172976.1 TetR/AcrR family transcriptional regulator [Dietzia cinnamea]
MTPAAPAGATSPRGDRRREALLAALDDRLKTTALDDISVADLTESAGITRSAFYFYFDSKAAAVGVLLAMVQDEADAAVETAVRGEGNFRTRVTAALERLTDRVLDKAHIYRALLTARSKHAQTRDLWDDGRRALAVQIAEFLRAERAAGRAPEGVDADALAVGLIHINETVLEQLAYDPGRPREPLLTVAADMWVRTVYGRPDPAVDPATDPGRTT